MHSFNNHFNSGVVDEEKIADYTSNREQFRAKGKSPDFKNAIRQMDEYISNPSVCFTFYFILLLYSSITINVIFI